MDRNNYRNIAEYYAHASLSARRAWIEISVVIIHILPFLVALRKESVDRNWCSNTAASACYTVALRKESVDRNTGASAAAALASSRSPQGERG